MFEIFSLLTSDTALVDSDWPVWTGQSTERRSPSAVPPGKQNKT